jgi:hypothetical protein
VSARVVNDKNFVKNLLNKKNIKISPKLTISEIINEAVGDAKVDDPTDYALTNGNFSAKLYTTENSEPFSIENDEPLNTALKFNPSIKYLNFTVNIDTNNDTVKLPSESESKTKDAYSLMMNTRGNEQRATCMSFVYFSDPFIVTLYAYILNTSMSFFILTRVVNVKACNGIQV